METAKLKPGTNVALLLISFSVFLYQVCLLRIISISDYYHFAFLVISIALLGFGISGSFLYFFTDRIKNHDLLLLVFSFLFTVSIFVSFLLINFIPFDSFRIAWELKQVFYLFAYYFSLLLPFFFGGSFIGYIFYEDKNPRLTYFFNLMGSAAGAIIFIFLVEPVGKTGVILITLVIGVIATILVMKKSYYKLFTALIIILAAAVVSIFLFFPALFEVRMSPYKSLPAILRIPGSEVIYSRENAVSRIDIVESQSIKSVPGLSLKYQEIPPPQLGLAIDGDNLSPVTKIKDKEISEFDFLEYIPASVIFNLPVPEDILIIEPGGGLDVLAAVYFSEKEKTGGFEDNVNNGKKQFGPQNQEAKEINGHESYIGYGSYSEPGQQFKITVIQNNSLIAGFFKDPEIKQGYFTDYTGHLYEREDISLIEASSRNYAVAADKKFGLVIVSLSESYRTISSGAYSLNENYLYTVQSFSELLKILDDDGVLAITRWAQTLPSEELKIVATLAESAEDLKIENLEDKIFAFRSWSTVTILFKKSGFLQSETASLKERLTYLNFDLIYSKDARAEETNIYNQLAATTHHDYFKKIIEGDSKKREEIYREYYFNIRPATDERPYFYDFFKFRQVPEIIKYFGKTTQPFGGGGYMVIIAALAIALAFSVILIIVPLRIKKISIILKADYRFLLYFTALGFGFFFIELPFMQKFILVLGKPAYSLSVILFAILLSAGIGSFTSSKKKIGLAYAIIVIVFYILAFIFFWAKIQEFLIIRPLWEKFLYTVLIIMPVGFFMGIPFPSGIAKAKTKRPEIIPWLWAINGCSSVVGSITAVIISIHLGFLTVIAISAVLYMSALAIYKRM